MARWKKAILGLAVFVAWFIGLIVVGGWGYQSQYFWVTGCIAAVVVGIAPFWRFRISTWYWITAALIIAGNIAALYFMRMDVANSELPSKGVVQLIFLTDCIGIWAVMVVIFFLIYRRLPWKFSDD